MEDRPIPLPPGTLAPPFTLPRTRHSSVSLRDFRGRRLLLVFYPADWEPVSREQLALSGEYLPTFEELRTRILGISPDGIWSHAAFARDASIRFPLLSDSHPKGAVARAYGAYLKHEGSSNRALFVVDERGIIRWSHTYPGPVKPGVDGALCAMESMGAPEDATFYRANQGEPP
jgi:peroxiredoxin